jgi:hypothetical protein
MIIIYLQAKLQEKINIFERNLFRNKLSLTSPFGMNRCYGKAIIKGLRARLK